MILAAEIETEQLCEKWRLICHRRHLMASQTLILPHLRIACQPTVVVTSLYHNGVKLFLEKYFKKFLGGEVSMSVTPLNGACEKLAYIFHIVVQFQFQLLKSW